MKKSMILSSVILSVLAACQALNQDENKGNLGLGIEDVIACPGQGMTHYANPPQINQEHIFCDEINRHRRVIGFHSRPGGHNPATVSNFNISQAANAFGIYGGIFTFTVGNIQRQKYSTMFPDSCTKQEVLNSILHAYTNEQPSCPEGAPDWARCGISNPSPVPHGEGPYCTGDNHEAFTIAFAVTQAGNINTAFPLYIADQE